MTTKDTITVGNQLTNVGHEKAISLLKARLTALLGQNTDLEDWTVKVTAAQTEKKIISIGRLFPESGGHVVYEQYKSEITTAKMLGGTVAHFRISKSIRHITTGAAFEEIIVDFIQFSHPEVSVIQKIDMTSRCGVMGDDGVQSTILSEMMN